MCNKSCNNMKEFSAVAAGLDDSVGWNTPEAVMMWWVGDNPLQMSFETPEYLK